MIQLTMHELKNIVTRKITILTLIILTLGTCAISILAVQQGERYMLDGKIITGKEAILYKQKEREKTQGSVTIDKVNQFQQHLYEINKATPLSQDEMINLLSTPDYVSQDLYTNLLLELYKAQGYSIFEAYERMYQNKTSNIYESWKDAVLQVDGQVSTSQQKDVKRLLNQVKIPFQQEAKTTYSLMISKFQDLMLLFYIILIIILASVFSKDRTTNASQVIIASKNGRKQLVKARIHAGMILTTFLYIMTILLYSLIIMAQIGYGGNSTSIQMGLFALSPYALNMLQAYVLILLLSYVSGLFLCCLTLYLSCRTKRAYHVILFLFLFVFFTYMMTQTMELNSGILRYLSFILPFACFDKYAIFGYSNFMIGDISIWLPLAGIGLLFIVMVLLRYHMLVKYDATV